LILKRCFQIFTKRTPLSYKLTCIVLLFLSCQKEENNPIEVFDYQVQSYYLIPSDINYNDVVERKILFSMNEMQKWYQTATGGYTFTFLNNKEKVQVVYLNNSTGYYKTNYWDRVINELAYRDIPINKEGLINYLWIGGVDDISQDNEQNILGLGGTSCQNQCGKTLLGTGLLNEITFYNDLGTVFHEMGHALGLSHPLEITDLPVNQQDSMLLKSVMCQADIRLEKENKLLGFLTTEKKILSESPFMKKNIQLNYNNYSVQHINYPDTDGEPFLDFSYFKENTTVVFETFSKSGLTYFWQFGDGVTSNEQNPTHNYPERKNYYTYVTVTSPGFMATTEGKVVYLE